MANVVKTIIAFRRATTAEWLANKDVIPAAGEPCFDLDLHTLKIGDGTLTYENLPTIGGVNVDVAADGKSIVLEDNVFKLMGFDAAEVGAQPRKNADGNIEWVVPSSETVEGLQTTVSGLQSDVATLQSEIDAVQEILTPSEEGSATLLDRIGALEDKIGSADSGTIDEKIDAKINEFAANISDNGIIDTFKELVDYVAEHDNAAADIIANIATLQGLVGEKSVQEQITEAVSGKVDAETDKGLSTNDFTDSLLAKLEGIEEGAQVNKIEQVYVGETLIEIVDKKVIIPIGAGLKVSDEFTISEDGTIGINAINFNKIVQTEDESVILDGGGALG